MPIYRITPNDVLFFRDARPMTGSSSGRGARWPEPNILFHAFHAALHRSGITPGHKHRVGKNGKYDDNNRTKVFGALQTAGPFPVQGDMWFFPRPQDAQPNNGRLVPLTRDAGRSDLPAPLQYPLANPAAPSKDEVEPWWSKAAIEAWMKDGASAGKRLKASDLFDAEWNTGIGINPETGTQDGVSLYSAEYMRLREGVHMGVIASMIEKPDLNERLDELFKEPGHIVVGGQQRVCNVVATPLQLDRVLPIGPEIAGERVKWLLLSPAVFPSIAARQDKNVPAHPGGWLPTWVDAQSGQVMLKEGHKVKRRGDAEGRPLDVNLVAARIPKPIHFSGWSLEGKPKEGNIKPTVLAVPAGAVYYFEGKDAPALAKLLNWHGQGTDQIANRRSSLFGEQGFGLGVCGPWEAFA